MKTRILTLSLALTLLLALALSACAAPSYKNDLPTATLGSAAVAAIGGPEDYSTAEEGYLDDYFTTPSYVTAYTLCFATDGNNLDEIGIYQVTDGNANAMKTVLEDYLEDSLERNQGWYKEYIPKEIPKLRDAEVKVFGNYVIYAICSKEDRAAVFSAVADLLKQN